MSGTHLFYNGVLLRDCETQEYTQTIQMDDSGTDVLYSRVRLSVASTLVSLVNIGSGSNTLESGTVHPSTITLPHVDGETIVDRWREVQTRLQDVRKDFWFALNSTTKKSLSTQTGYDPNGTDLPIPASSPADQDSYRVVMAATGLSEADITALRADRNASLGLIKAFNPAGLTQSQFVDIERSKVIDLDNGPMPISVRVEQILGGRALRVVFSIEVCRCFCKPSDSADLVPPAIDAAKAKGVISNRWGVSDSIDEEGRVERTVAGKLVIADRSWQPHAMRLMVTPTLLPYSKWTNRSYVTDPKGLALEYRLSQKTTGPAAPSGIMDWSGTYTESNAVGAGQTTGDITVRVTGRPNPENLTLQQQKQGLLAQAYNIVRSRVRFELKWQPLPGQDPKFVTVLKTVVVEQMHRPSLELRMSFLYRDRTEGNNELAIDGFGLRLKNMGADMSNAIPGYDPKWWPVTYAHPEDVANENSSSLAAGFGSLYDTYFQTPCSEWHGMPRGYYLDNEEPRAVSNANGSRGDGLAADRLSASVYVDPGMSTQIPSTERPAPGTLIASVNSGFNVQQGAFSYLVVEMDTQYTIDSGNVQLPLSKARTYSAGTNFNATAVVQRLHAGVCQRKITMIASRLGQWPQVPAPVASTVQTGARQDFLRGSMIPETPQVTNDGQGLMYKVQIQWVYAVNRLPQAGDRLMVGSSPIDSTTPQQNSLPISGFFDYSGAIEVTA